MIKRLQMAWAILRGRSVMYRVKVEHGVGVEPLTEGFFVVECELIGPAQYGVKIALNSMRS